MKVKKLVRKSELYDIIDGEFRTLCEEAKLRLDWNLFDKAYEEMRSGDYREAEKRDLLLGACVEVTEPVRWKDR